jgi:5-(carboxyamino)imidazole ribonucleotide synthase
MADEIVIGSHADENDVYRFGKDLDIILLEFEDINISALKKLKQEGKTIICDPNELEIIQDKGKQKMLYKEHAIPTADFFLADDQKEIRKKNVPLPFVLKKRTQGYDGGGVKKINTLHDLSSAWDAPSVGEECIDIKKEYSLIVGRDQSGNTFRYPVVEQHFHNNAHLVHFLVAPIELKQQIQTQIDTIGDQVLNAFSTTGMWAIELFLDADEKVLVNEIAPRVHNSGHHTIEGSATSQFSQFIRLALGLPHGSTKTLTPTVTMNILGPEGKSGAYQAEGLSEVLKTEGIFLHLYGKKTTRPFRKLGHITTTGETTDDCWKKIRSAQQSLQIVVE